MPEKIQTTRDEVDVTSPRPFVKVLTKDGMSPYANYKWHVPYGDSPARKMRRVSGALEMCYNGYHFTTIDQYMNWTVNATDRVWYVEVDLPYTSRSSKYLTKGARIISEVPEELLDPDFVIMRRAFNAIHDMFDEKRKGVNLPFTASGGYFSGKNYYLFSDDNNEFIYELRGKYGAIDYTYTGVSSGFIMVAEEISTGHMARVNDALVWAATCIARRELSMYKDYVAENPKRYPENMPERIVETLMKGVIPIGFNKTNGKLLTMQGEMD